MNFFGYDGPFFNTMNRVTDIIILNVIWIICCIPIVTIGASTTALFYVMMKMAKDEDASVVRSFFRSFKENFLQSTVIWLIMLLIAGMLVGDYFILPNMKLNDQVYSIMFGLLCLSALVYLMVLVFLFPLQAKFENKIKHTFKNAVLLSIRHMPTSLLLAGILVLIPFAMYWTAEYLPVAFIAWIILGYSSIAFGCSFLYNRIFDIYINRPKTTETTENGESSEEENQD